MAELRALGVPACELIIAHCTCIQVEESVVRLNRDHHRIRVVARYLSQDLDSEVITRFTRQEAAGIAVGIVAKSIEMINNGERGPKSFGGYPRRPARKPRPVKQAGSE